MSAGQTVPNPNFFSTIVAPDLTTLQNNVAVSELISAFDGGILQTTAQSWNTTNTNYLGAVSGYTGNNNDFFVVLGPLTGPTGMTYYLPVNPNNGQVIIVTNGATGSAATVKVNPLASPGHQIFIGTGGHNPPFVSALSIPTWDTVSFVYNGTANFNSAGGAGNTGNWIVYSSLTASGL